MSVPPDRPAAPRPRALHRTLLHRHQSRSSWRHSLKAGFGGMLGIALVAGLGQWSGMPLLMAPLGASCVLLFSLPSAPLSQPVNVLGGHLLATVIGLVLAQFLPTNWWTLALGVGLAIAAMQALRITHPPAGANPLVILLARPDWSFLLFPVLSGCILLVLMARLLAHLPPRSTYPVPPPESPS